MAATKVILILGAGPRIGLDTAKLFASKGYKVAVTSRSDSSFDPAYLNIKADLSNPSSVKDVFAAVKKQFGNPPNVVVYNAWAGKFSPNGDDPLSMPLGEFENDLAINTTSAFAAAREATRGFLELPEDLPKSFIYTGNGLNTTTMATLMNLGVGKNATAHIIELASKAYEGKGWTFYYCDERFADGKFAGMEISGPGHAQRYWEISQERKQNSWLDTFVSGVGYKKF